MKEYWGVQRGGDQIAKGHNVHSVGDIAETIGESAKTPDEMTVRELREVKAALKAEQVKREQGEAQAKTAL